MSEQIVRDAEARIAQIRDERARAVAKAELDDLVGKLRTAPGWTTGLRLAFAGHPDRSTKLGAIQAKTGSEADAAITFQQAVRAASNPFMAPFGRPSLVVRDDRAGSGPPGPATGSAPPPGRGGWKTRKHEPSPS